jgi:hypothetical protein
MNSTTSSQTDSAGEAEPNISQGLDTSRLSFSRGETGRSESRRLLFLDDDPLRAEAFLVDRPEAIWVQTVTECLSRLIEPWDEVHLDHDLGGRQFVDPREVDCGMEVIRWLCQEPRLHLRETLFFIHTHNSMAGLLMVLQMRAQGYRAEFNPFGVDLSRLLLDEEPISHDGLGPAHPPVPILGRWLVWLRSLWSSVCGRAS